MTKIKILFAIFVFAALIRLIGTNPGYPFTHPDEPTIYESARNIAIKHDTKPYAYYYGSLLPTFYASADFLFLPIEYGKFFIQSHARLAHTKFNDWEELWESYLKRNLVFEYWSRYETAIFGALTVVAIYLLATEIFDYRIGLVSAFFTAVNYRHVISSLFSLADAPSAFFVSLSLYLSCRILKNTSLKNYLIAAIGIVFSLSVKYFVYTIPTFLLCHIISNVNKSSIKSVFKNIFLNRKLLLSLLVILGLFLIINPYIILDYKRASDQFIYNAMRYGISTYQTHNLTFPMNFKIKSLYPIWYLYKYGLGKIISIGFVLGFFLIFIKHPKQFLILLSILFPFFYFFLVISGTTVVRNYASIIPILTIFPAILIVWIVDTLKTKFRIRNVFVNVLLISLTVFFSFSSLTNSTFLVLSLHQTRNKNKTEQWMIDNIPTDSKIIQFWQSPLPQGYSSDYWKPSINSLKSFAQITHDHQQWMIANSEISTYLNNTFGLITDDSVNQETYTSLLIKELAGYRIQTFDKGFPLTIETSYFVAKFPDSFNLNFNEKSQHITSPDTLKCKNDFYKILLKTNTSRGLIFYRVLAKSKVSVTARSPDPKNGFLRMDFLDVDGNILKSYVSQLMDSDNKDYQMLEVLGASPPNTHSFKLYFQEDICSDNNNYKITNIEIDETDRLPFNLDQYPYFFSELPKNFIWMPPL